MSKKAAANVVSDPPSYAAYARQRGESPAPPRETGIVAVAESLQHRIEALGNTMKELREALGGVLRDAPPAPAANLAFFLAALCAVTFGVGWMRRDGKGGWVRLSHTGPGLSWCLRTEPLLFSQRMKQTRYLHVGKWRVRYLPRVKATP